MLKLVKKVILFSYMEYYNCCKSVGSISVYNKGEGGFSNTSGATISFVLCANTMYGNNLALNKPVEKL